MTGSETMLGGEPAVDGRQDNIMKVFCCRREVPCFANEIDESNAIVAVQFDATCFWLDARKAGLRDIDVIDK